MRQILLAILALALVAATPTPTPAPANIGDLYLFQGDTRIGRFLNSTLTSGLPYTVKVGFANPTTESVKFLVDGAVIATDDNPKDNGFQVTWTPGVLGAHDFVASGLNSAGQGNSVSTAFTVIGASPTASPTPSPTPATPTPTATVSPSPSTSPSPSPPTPTPQPTPTAPVSPSPSPSPTPTATVTPTPTPVPTPKPTPTPTPSPSPSPTPTPTATPAQTRTVVVLNPTDGDTYEIYCNGALIAILNGASSAGVPDLIVGQTYTFANRVLHNRVPSAMSDPISYTVTAATNQEVSIP